MNQSLTAAEVLFLQEHARISIAGARFHNHCANETGDADFKQYCQTNAREKMAEAQRVMGMLGNAGGMAGTIQ